MTDNMDRLVEFDYRRPNGRPKPVYTVEQLTFRGIVFGNMTRRQDAELAYNEAQKRKAAQVRAAEIALNPPPVKYNEDGSVKRGRGRPPGSLGKKKLAEQNG